MKIITTEEAAKLLRTDIRTLQRQAKKGDYPINVCGRIGRKYLFNEEALIQFIFSNKAIA
ncbi:MAG: helix-turn-helix domain-containing protein [Candidatus Gastranaerophilales bacterium]|nr:helix-turn-helix domain-containing protein [Candidatus Gastranaerophilales bacterium]